MLRLMGQNVENREVQSTINRECKIAVERPLMEKRTGVCRSHQGYDESGTVVVRVTRRVVTRSGGKKPCVSAETRLHHLLPRNLRFAPPLPVSTNCFPQCAD